MSRVQTVPKDQAPPEVKEIYGNLEENIKDYVTTITVVGILN